MLLFLPNVRDLVVCEVAGRLNFGAQLERPDREWGEGVELGVENSAPAKAQVGTTQWQRRLGLQQIRNGHRRRAWPHS